MSRIDDTTRRPDSGGSIGDRRGDRSDERRGGRGRERPGKTERTDAGIPGLLTDEGAVSPVIGVILMVAIVVILAAVIGTFVLGIGQDRTTTPQLSIDFEYDKDTRTLTVIHASGDTLDSENTGGVFVSISGPINGKREVTGAVLPFSAGDTLELPGVPSDATIRIIWESPSGEDSTVLASYTAA